LDYAQAIILGVIQGVTELFPVSSLGHSVILPALFGWTNVVAAQSAAESFFLAFLVGLHVATALALAFFYRVPGCESSGGCCGPHGADASRRPTSAWAGCS
jgi:undecaprenyl-diphosphatase